MHSVKRPIIIIMPFSDFNFKKASILPDQKWAWGESHMLTKGLAYATIYH